jgi:protein-tyrosine phosphatase
METRVFKVAREPLDREALKEPAGILADGGLVAFPTETVYGIATSFEHQGSVERLASLRGDANSNVLTVHLADPGDLQRWVTDMPPAAERLMRRLWPGPLMLMLTCADGQRRGFRLPDDPVAREFLRFTGAPVIGAAAAAGPGPFISDPSNVLRAISGRIDALVDAGATRFARPSTVVEFGPRGTRIVRQGVIPREQVESAARARILFVCTGNTCRYQMADALIRRALALRLVVSEDQVEERGFAIESAGVSAANGSRMSEDAERVLGEMGVRRIEHSSRSLTPEILKDADRIYAMTRSQLERVIMMSPDVAGRARRLDPGRDVEDPVGAGADAYRATAKQIKKALDLVVKSI